MSGTAYSGGFCYIFIGVATLTVNQKHPLGNTRAGGFNPGGGGAKIAKKMFRTGGEPAVRVSQSTVTGQQRPRRCGGRHRPALALPLTIHEQHRSRNTERYEPRHPPVAGREHPLRRPVQPSLAKTRARTGPVRDPRPNGNSIGDAAASTPALTPLADHGGPTVDPRPAGHRPRPRPRAVAPWPRGSHRHQAARP